ncbi:MAG: ABC transporter permease [Candidatus Acidiferrales bacterium]
MEDFLSDLKYGYRMLAKKPAFTLLAVLTLALGIGANIATYSIVHGVLFQPLPFQRPEQLVRVYDDLRGSNSKDVSMSVPELWDFQQRAGIFQDIAGIFPTDANLTGGDHPERIELLATSGNYFTMLHANPQVGRIYTQQTAVPGFSGEVVISDGLWHREFGGDPKALGKRLRLDNDLYTIVGVMPPGFHNPGRTVESDVDVWASCGFAGDPFPPSPPRSVRIVPGALGRLKPDLTIARAQVQFDAFAAHLREQYPTDYPAKQGWNLRLVSIQEDLVGNVRTELLALFGAVSFVLLIACVNLATFLLARASQRQREVAIRLAMGAGRGRLIRQLLTENVMLAAIAGTLAISMLFLFKNSLLTLAPSNLPRLNEVSIDWHVLLFAFAISIVSGVLFSLAPALQAANPSQVASLREGSRGAGTSARQARLSGILVASEIALSLVLLIGAGLLVRSFQNLLRENPGFDPHNVLTARVWIAVPNDPATDPYRSMDKRIAFNREVIRRVSALPGVEAAGVGNTSSLPMGPGRNRISFTIEGRPAESDQAPVAETTFITPEVLPILKVPLKAGRLFTDSDDNKSAPVILIDENLAQRYWSGENPIGHRINFPTLRSQTNVFTIVGIVGDVKSEGLDNASVPHIYVPTYQMTPADLVVFLKTSAGPAELDAAIRREVQSIDPNMPVFGVRTMNEVLARSMAEHRFARDIIGIFAILALILATIGIYGVMAYAVSQRTHEIGIRIALGAQRADILRMTVGEGLVLIAFGLAAGLAGAALLTQFVRAMLYGVKPTDPLTFLAVPAVLAAVALLACYLPARRATQVDPLVALREE